MSYTFNISNSKLFQTLTKVSIKNLSSCKDKGIRSPQCQKLQFQQSVNFKGYTFEFVYIAIQKYSQCTMYRVQFTVLNVVCTMQIEECTMQSLQCTYSVQCKVCNGQCTSRPCLNITNRCQPILLPVSYKIVVRNITNRC